MIRIHSRDNPLVKELRKLLASPGAYRKTRQVVLEGAHLCQAWRASPLGLGREPRHVIVSESRFAQIESALIGVADAVVTMPDVIMGSFCTLESPPDLVYVVDLPEQPGRLRLARATTVVLDRLQDPGNVGSILRTAAAFGIRQVLALKGTAALWSAKVLRAGQGAHFSLDLFEVDAIEARHAIDLAQLPIVATSSHAAEALDSQPLPREVVWVFGHEGQGVDAAWLEQARTLRIPQVTQESLNVAAAAAICLFHQRSGLHP